MPPCFVTIAAKQGGMFCKSVDFILFHNESRTFVTGQTVLEKQNFGALESSFWILFLI